MKNIFFFICFFLFKNLLAQDTTIVSSSVMDLEEKIKKESVYAEKVKAFKKLGEIQTEKNLGTAKITFEKLYDFAKSKNDTLTMSQSLVELMWRSISLYQSNEALAYASQMETLLKDKNNNESDFFYLAKAKSTKGHAYIILGKFDMALENSLAANELFGKFKNKSNNEIKQDLINNYLTIATVYKYIDNYDKAMESIDIALELSKENAQLKNLLGKSYNIKGDIYSAMDNVEESLVYYKKGLNFFINSNDSINIPISLKRIGSFYDKTKDFKESIRYYKKALVINKKMNQLDFMSYLYTALAISNAKLNKNELALKYIDSSLAISTNFEFEYMKIDALVNKARIYKNKGNYDYAIQILENVKLLFDNSKDYQDTLMNIHKTLANLYNETGEMKKSINSFDKYIQIKETLIEENVSTKTKILEVEYNYRNITAKLEKKEIALQLSEIKQKRFKANTYLIISSIVFLFGFIVFIVLKQRKHAKVERLVLESKQELLQIKKETLDREVEFKSKNLTDFALQINEKNDLLEKIKTQLKEIKPANNYSKDALLDTILFINEDINQNTEKIQLYSKIDKNNDDFEAKINERFENLTDKERKVATMVRIGKTSKQIATQLNISVASVDNYRYTVRKKMKVPKGKPLGTFIKNI